jgi:hypothetical protein
MESISSCIAACHAASCSALVKVHDSPVLIKFSSLDEVARCQSRHVLPCANNVVVGTVAHRQLPVCRIQSLLIVFSGVTNSSGGVVGPATDAAPDCGLSVATGIEGGAADVLTLGVGELEACGDAGLAAVAAPDAPA